MGIVSLKTTNCSSAILIECCVEAFYFRKYKPFSLYDHKIGAENDTCAAYCNVVQSASLDYLVIDILASALGRAGPPPFGSARSVLPACIRAGEGETDDEGGCWHRVATDRGVCFASYDGECRKYAFY